MRPVDRPGGCGSRARDHPLLPPTPRCVRSRFSDQRATSWGRSGGDERPRFSGLPEAGGTQRVSGFRELADAYGVRLETSDWDSVLGEWSGLGELTVGGHAGVAVGEWNVHAWDLARATGGDHRPDEPGLFAECQAVVGRVVDVGGSADPWTAVLVATGATRIGAFDPTGDRQLEHG